MADPKVRMDSKAKAREGKSKKPFYGSSISRMTRKGQVTISAGLRAALGLRPGDEVLMSLNGSDKTISVRRIMSFGELLDSLPLAVVAQVVSPPRREAMAEEAAGR